MTTARTLSRSERLKLRILVTELKALEAQLHELPAAVRGEITGDGGERYAGLWRMRAETILGTSLDDDAPPPVVTTEEAAK